MSPTLIRPELAAAKPGTMSSTVVTPPFPRRSSRIPSPVNCRPTDGGDAGGGGAGAGDGVGGSGGGGDWKAEKVRLADPTLSP